VEIDEDEGGRGRWGTGVRDGEASDGTAKEEGGRAREEEETEYVEDGDVEEEEEKEPVDVEDRDVEEEEANKGTDKEEDNEGGNVNEDVCAKTEDEEEESGVFSIVSFSSAVSLNELCTSSSANTKIGVVLVTASIFLRANSRTSYPISWISRDVLVSSYGTIGSSFMSKTYSGPSGCMGCANTSPPECSIESTPHAKK
jgi:hypothetical protein